MCRLSELVGESLLAEIESDVQELKSSCSTIHFDELLVKYGEMGANPVLTFLVLSSSSKMVGGSDVAAHYVSKYKHELYKFTTLIGAI